MKKNFDPHTNENENVSHTVFAGLCKGCRICREICPQKCIGLDENVRGVYKNKIVKCDVDRCIACMKCETSCPDRAIRVVKKKHIKTVDDIFIKSPTSNPSL